MRLEGVRETSNQSSPSSINWEQLLGDCNSSSPYKLLYNLHVIEYLIEEDSSSVTSEESSELKELKSNWCTDFIKLGGLDNLLTKF